MLEIVILTLAFVLHMWSFPYPFKSVRFEFVLRLIEILFSLSVIGRLFPRSLQIDRIALLTGVLVGIACLIFHIVYNRGIKLKKRDFSKSFVLSQIFILFLQIPSEEFLYRGVFFSIINGMWGTGAAMVISVALSSMIYIATWRRPLYWTGATLVSFFCALGIYYTGSIWTAVLIHILNDIGYVTLNERKNIFTSSH